MGEYLTIEEAADRLGVEYKTLYRLVRNGDLPAGRIGRIYRIREEDLTGYFDRQKQLLGESMLHARRNGLTALAGLKCGSCGKEILSELSIGGRCDECDAEICQACWAIKKVRACPSHGSEDEVEVGGRGPGIGRGQDSPALMGDSRHPTPVPSSDPRPPSPEPSKRQASAESAPRTVTSVTPEQAIAQLRHEGKPVVTGPEAALLEASFIRAFAQRLEQVEELPDPLAKLGGRISLRQARVKHAVEATAGADAAKQPAGALPGNRVSRFTLKAGGWGRPKSCLVVAGRFLARPAAIKSQGYDAEPIGEAELIGLLNQLSDEAKKAGCFHVMLLCSPTGWADAATKLMSRGDGPAAAFHDRRLAVALCDGRTDAVWLDDADDRLRPFWPIVAPRKYAERLAGCVKQVRDLLVRKNSLSLADATRVCAADPTWVRAAFAEVERSGTGEGGRSFTLDELPEIGLVISRVSV